MAQDTLLAIDVGNTHIVIGLMDGRRVVRSMRCATDKNKTADEFAFLIQNFLSLHGFARAAIGGCIISSVVPQLKRSLSSAIRTLLGLEAYVVGPGLKTGLNIRIENPAELGSDLVVDALAALERYAPPLIVVDMGTATTLSVIDEKKIYQGGLIIPGLGIAVEALASHAAQLRHIDFSAPEQLIGKSTVNCMKAGAIYGQAAMLDGLIERIEAELGQACTVVATGGLVSAVIPFCRRKIHYERHLLLEGLALLYEKNRPAEGANGA